MTRWGRRPDTSANATLLIVGLLLAASGWMLGTGYDSAQARIREHRSWATGEGPHPSNLPMVSDDGGDTWHYTD